MKPANPYLPGLEDVRARPGPRGWDEALGRLSRKPARRIVLLALRAIAGSRAECCPTNAAIARAIAELGETPPSEDGLTALLRALERDDGLLRRAPDRRAHSRRRIHFAFLVDEMPGVDRPHPRVSIVHTLGCRSSTPLGVDRPHPDLPLVEEPPTLAPAPVSPLNSNSIEEREETLTLRAWEGEQTIGPPAAPRAEPVPGTHQAVMARWAALIEKTAREEAAAPPTPAPARPPAPASTAPVVAHVETVDLLRRLASPCGPEAVEAAATRLAEKLDDAHSLAWHRKVCERVRAGEIRVKTVLGAYRQAMSGTNASPRKVFNAFISRHGPAPCAQKSDPGAHSAKLPRGRSR